MPRVLVAGRIRRFGAMLLATMTLTAAADQSGPMQLADGVYTEAQADAGEVLYEKHCLICHDKKYFRPVLKTWAGQSLGTFYMTMATTMPENSPGFLYDEEYLEILAYILELNRYSTGDQPLVTGSSLERIVIGPPS